MYTELFIVCLVNSRQLIEDFEGEDVVYYKTVKD